MSSPKAARFLQCTHFHLAPRLPLRSHRQQRQLLWGGAKKRVTLGLQISQTIRAHTGLVMNPHLFRHAMAKIYLDAHPGGYEVVRRVLAHRSIDTTTAFYTGVETAAAVRHFDDTVLRVRRNRGRR